MFWVSCYHMGSAAAWAQTTKGKVVISDSIFMNDNIYPGVPIGVLENNSECQDALERVRNEADSVIPKHDNRALELYTDGIIALNLSYRANPFVDRE